MTTTYDGAGRPVSVNDQADLATTADDLCTVTTYAENLSLWIRDTVATVQTVARRCGSPPVFPNEMVSGVQVYYDGATAVTAAPTKGHPTRTTRAQTWSMSSGWTYVTTGTAGYDALGRATSTADALAHATTTAYTPAGALPVTSTTVTNPAGQATTIGYDPALGPLTVADPNGNTTTGGYDALGRVVAVWGPGRKPGLSTPTTAYAYKITGSSVNAITTTRLIVNDGTVSSTVLFDGLLRPIQTQTPAPQYSGQAAVVTTTGYDSRGLTPTALGPFAITAAPSTSMVYPAQLTSVPTAHHLTFDGAGRVATDLLKINDVAKWSTTTLYFGTATTVVPPAGGTTTTTVVDARGRTSQLVQANGTPTPDVTAYTYTPAGQLATLTDPAGSVWTYGYDLAGNTISTTSPDRGPTSATYDLADNLITSTDARGGVLWRGYDVLDRQTQLRVAGSTGALLAAWTYDTATRGIGLPATATRYSAGNPYTTAVTGYTPDGQPTAATTTIPAVEGALAGTYTTTTTYTSSGQPSTYRPVTAPGLPGGETLVYAYDNADNVTDIDTSAGAIITGVRRNPYGNITGYELGNTPTKLTHVRMTYQTGTQRLATTTIQRDTTNLANDANISYSYNDIGTIKTIRDTAAPGGGDRQCFTYDTLQRLTDAWAQPGTSGNCATTPSTTVLGGTAPYWTTYSYDHSGNRISEVQHATTPGPADTTRTYTHTPTPWSPTSQTGPHRLTQTTQTGAAGTRTDTYTYNNAGQTTQVSTPAGTQTLTWNSENHLATVTDTATGATNTSYLYDADGTRLIRRDTGANPAVTPYLGDTEITLNTTTGTKTSTRYYTYNGQTIAVRNSDGITATITDHHNTGTFEIDFTTGALTATRRPAPFGHNRTTTGTWKGSHGFVNGTQDPTGYTQLGARPYNPTTGRFLSLDPIIDPSNPQQLNGYTYANNNPTNLTDPTGLLARNAQPSQRYAVHRVHQMWLKYRQKLKERLTAYKALVSRKRKSMNSKRPLKTPRRTSNTESRRKTSREMGAPVVTSASLWPWIDPLVSPSSPQSGICAGARGAQTMSVSGSVCLTVTVSHEGIVELGFTRTVAAGVGTPQFGFGLFGQESTAERTSDMARGGWQLGASGGPEAPVTGGFTVSDSGPVGSYFGVAGENAPIEGHMERTSTNTMVLARANPSRDQYAWLGSWSEVVDTTSIINLEHLGDDLAGS